MSIEADDGVDSQSSTSLTVIAGGKEPSGKLTGKQFSYVQAILRGANQSDAYREAYNAQNMSDQAIWTEAGRLFRHPEVSRRVTAGRAAQERQAVHTGASLRLHVEKELFALSTKAESDQSRLRALELLGKLDKVGAFTERVAQVSGEQTAEEVQAELAGLLGQYLDDAD
jgi:phage terminase small subunit